MSAKSPLTRAVDFGASYGNAVVLLFFLFLLTLFGTLEQVEHGLFEVQRKYFESFFLVADLGEIFDLPFRLPLPLPGAVLVLSLLTLNLLCGGLIRIRKNKSTLGVIIIHVGIVLMFAAGLVKLTASEDGHLTLFETESSDEFVSYYLWEVAIFDATQRADVQEHIIPDAAFLDLTGDRAATFTSPDLPFTVTLSHVAKNCRPLPKGPMWAADSPVVEGYALRAFELEEVAEQNVAGLHVRVDFADGESVEGLLWGFERSAWTFRTDGRVWGMSLRHKRYKMPFTVVLDDFTRELHPNTGIPKAFMSDITKREGGSESRLRISMNEPLRHGGLVLFQSSWGPSNAGPGDPLFSVFSVVRNPSDHWPAWSCGIIALGMIIAFGQKLYRYIRAQAAARQRLQAGEAQA
ncbi:MAG: hypothetical protein E2O39_00490 [Planctomycetota bacterium]|nr:MAG: hypothetical protein E2O39_00490 [Planctomycetota bacterium]